MSEVAKILLVDDVRENLLAMRAALRREDAEVITASSGREALEVFLTTDVAVAVLDVQMPEMNGYELAELLRGMERTRTIPLLFVTAGPHDPRSVFRGYESGAVDFLFKPIEPHVLSSKINVFLELYRQRALLAEKVLELERVERRLREADQRKDEFLAVLSHELRNPLTPLRNSIFILQNAEPASDRAIRAMQVIERQTDHLIRLVDDLLDITRIARGKIQLRTARVDLRELVRRTVDDFRPMIERKGVSLETELPAEIVWGDVDGTRITQALANLLHNAAKFTREGDRVTVWMSRRGADVEIGVRDSGAGIDPELLPQVFDPFVQGERTLARTDGGLGLGLALVKGIAEMHGGDAAAASVGKGKGASFTIRFPAVPAGEPVEPAIRDLEAAR